MPSVRPLVNEPIEYGNATSFWVEYPSGLVDLSRSHHVSRDANDKGLPPPLNSTIHADIPVDRDRTIRVDKGSSALVVIDMQNYFLHPDLKDHPLGLKCVDPLVEVLPVLRSQGVKIIWVNWGLTEHELTTIPPALVRGFMKTGKGFGLPLPGNFGRLLMRGEANSELYGPLQEEFIKGQKAGTDVWIHKNRMSGLWGYQTALDLYLEETGTNTLFFAGVNADQCVLGTVVDAYFRGYDCVLVSDLVATTSPPGSLENLLYNTGGTYGFVTDTKRVIQAMQEEDRK